MGSTSFAAGDPRPLIGVFVSLAPSGLGAELDAMGQEFTNRAVRAIASAGGDPMLVDISAPDRDPVALVGQFAGLLLLGGADIDPALYGAVPHPTTYGVDTEADRYEIAAVRGALDRGTPLVGICRGMQVLNVAAGGTLLQDLGAESPHLGPPDTLMVTQQVRLVPDSRLGRILQRSEAAVRSGHHQALARVAEGFAVVARADDGVIEAIEHANTWAIGVQWHPEDPEADERDLAAIATALVAQAAAALRLRSHGA